MIWKVGLLVTALAAAAISAINVTESAINKTDPFGGLDANGVILNETELLRISDEDMDFYNENSIEERKVCKPTTSCTHAGGHCIKGGAKCDGTVDKKGCKGGKKCKCCKPEVCKPTTSCTRAGGHCIKGGAKCDGTVDKKGCKGGKKCKCCIPATECPEDEGFFYQDSSQQCFFWPNKTNTWNQVSSFCDEKGLIIAHPKDPIGLRRMMVPLYGHAEPWVNTLRVGNTNNYQWQDDSTILASDSSLWFPGQPEEYGQGCVILLVWDWRLNTNPDQPYYARPCSGYGPPYYGYYTLCELVLA